VPFYCLRLTQVLNVIVVTASQSLHAALLNVIYEMARANAKAIQTPTMTEILWSCRYDVTDSSPLSIGGEAAFPPVGF
jgi:hypothetical protein